MIKIDKDFNAKIASVIVSIVFLCSAVLHASPILKENSLRVPMGKENYEQISESMKALELDNLYVEIGRNSKTVQGGDLLVKQPEKLQLMSRMFNGAPAIPIETDIFGFAIEDFPQSFIQFLDEVVNEWLDIFPQSKRHYRVSSPTFHVSIIAPQDISMYPDEGQGVLGDYSKHFSFEEHEKVFKALLYVLKDTGHMFLVPRGVLYGEDGALIFVFEYEPTLYSLRTRFKKGVLQITDKLTGRQKDIVHISLFRVLENVELDEDMARRIREFAFKYENVTPLLEELNIPLRFEISQIHFSHETRWMHTRKNFDVTLELGKDNSKALKAFLRYLLAGGEKLHLAMRRDLQKSL